MEFSRFHPTQSAAKMNSAYALLRGHPWSALRIGDSSELRGPWRCSTEIPGCKQRVPPVHLVLVRAPLGGQVANKARPSSVSVRTDGRRSTAVHAQRALPRAANPMPNIINARWSQPAGCRRSPVHLVVLAGLRRALEGETPSLDPIHSRMLGIQRGGIGRHVHGQREEMRAVPAMKTKAGASPARGTYRQGGDACHTWRLLAAEMQLLDRSAKREQGGPGCKATGCESRAPGESRGRWRA